MPILKLENLEKRYGDHVAASNVTLTVEQGEFVSLLGPSGCGKTTVLRMVAGLVTPTSGNIFVGTKNVTNVPTNRRNIGLVFQSYALFPHMTVYENVAFGLRRQGVKGHELEKRVNNALASVRLAEYGSRYPRQLSGGQQQRVAVARSVAPQPSVLLFDEPLSNLDAALRDEMQFELKRLQSELGITTLFVTHDQTEALSMADRVCVLANGVVQQFASPEEIYNQPATPFVASFIGKSNQLAGTIKSTTNSVSIVELAPNIHLTCTGQGAGFPVGTEVDVVLRQEDLLLSITPHDGALAGQIMLRSFVGSRVQYAVRLNGTYIELILEVPANGDYAGLDTGANVHVWVSPDRVYVSCGSTEQA